MRTLRRWARSLHRRKAKLFPRRSLSRWVPGGAFLRERLLGWLAAETALVHGMPMRVDLFDSLGLLRRPVFEAVETAFVRETVAAGATVLDLGANIGYFTLLLARLVGPEGRVYSFEPDPRNVAVLRGNVAANGLAQVVVEPKAVSDRQGRLPFHQGGTNLGDNRLGAFAESVATIEVEVVSLDAYFGEALPPIRFIKMDIQGAEFQALRGMDRLLRGAGDLDILSEFWPEGLEETAQEAGDAYRHLAGLGFAFVFLNGDGSREEAPIDRLLSLIAAKDPAIRTLLLRKRA